MTGTTRSSADLEPRRRKALIRSWRRGTREMDLVLGGFADSHLESFSPSEMDEFERILALPDTDLLPWITGKVAPPPEVESPLFEQIRTFCANGIE
ncbi:succinate dehydrogenase assembly factor 2 [Nitratireductor basaltis]|uniref:FAD assembly factor SdhE n=1 Tax=Nitratireductor basaltis TaxID=472175 RepID=A0A084UAP1_9HYPH|nr:succinate dehydrogenase assembly factor 2 [Nitratireductor basaltis]KFB10027.1 hypothetical protein EL18_01055 [Nitratireductor basaltis]